MEGLNRVFVAGHLAADPEFRMVGSSPLLKLRLAVSEKFKDKEGKMVEKTEWINVSLWGNRAEGLSRLLSKGTFVFVEGSIRNSSYEKNGQKFYTSEVRASNLILGQKARENAAVNNSMPQDTTSNTSETSSFVDDGDFPPVG